MPRAWRAGDNFRRETLRTRGRRADRHALWALLLGLFTLAVAAASAHAASGGVPIQTCISAAAGPCELAH